MGHIVILACFLCKAQSLDYVGYFLLYKRQKFTCYRKIAIFESIDITNNTDNMPKKGIAIKPISNKSSNTEIYRQ